MLKELNNYNLDEDDIYAWVYSLDKTKVNSKYLAVSIVRMVKDEGKFIKVIKVKAKQSLSFVQFWKGLNIETETKDKFFVEQLIQKIYENGCPLSKLRKSTDTIKTDYHPKSAKEFLALLKTSKLIKQYGVNLEEWENNTTDYFNQWETIMNSLESVYE